MYSMMTGQGKGFGMGKALAQLGMDFDGTPHRGVDDARMTAKILLCLLEKAQ
jgi:inhibitor of KinA sporulation pathway (predicted exonuclease)